MPSVVLDASTVVSAALNSRSVPARAVFLARKHDVVAFSDAVLEEIERVLRRPKFDRYFGGGEREEALRTIIVGSVRIAPADTVADCRDAKDKKYLELALAATAATIVTGDGDLKVLDPWRGIRILSPADDILRLEQRLARSF